MGSFVAFKAGYFDEADPAEENNSYYSVTKRKTFIDTSLKDYKPVYVNVPETIPYVPTATEQMMASSKSMVLVSHINEIPFNFGKAIVDYETEWDRKSQIMSSSKSAQLLNPKEETELEKILKSKK